jgi:hypothetical protein
MLAASGRQSIRRRVAVPDLCGFAGIIAESQGIAE